MAKSEMRNKKLVNRRNDITQGRQFCSPSYRFGKGRGKKKNKLLQHGVFVFGTNFAEQGLTLLNRLNMLLSLWCSDSTLNTFC